MKISQVAQLTGLSSKSIRFYESKGLIIPPDRESNGYRDYSWQQIEQLRLIASARQVGFSLEECAALLQLAQNKQRTSAEIKYQTQQKVAEIENKIMQLQQIKTLLESWIDQCPGNDNADCPILENLYHYQSSDTT